MAKKYTVYVRICRISRLLHMPRKAIKKKKKVVPVDEHASAENRGSITDINYTLDFSSRANMLIRN